MIDNLKHLLKYFDLRSEIMTDFSVIDSGKLDQSIVSILKERYYLKPSDIGNETFKELFLMIARTFESDYVIDSLNEKFINDICLYIRFDKDFLKINPEFKSGKGLLILGSIGTGKTLILKTLSKILSLFAMDYYNYDNSFKIYPTYKIVGDFVTKGYEIFDSVSYYGYDKSIIGLDDLGAETKIQYFGTPVNVLGEYIMRKYDRMLDRKKTILLCTTNLNGEQLKEFYGERVHDRLIELVNPIVLTGKSRRK